MKVEECCDFPESSFVGALHATTRQGEELLGSIAKLLLKVKSVNKVTEILDFISDPSVIKIKIEYDTRNT